LDETLLKSLRDPSDLFPFIFAWLHLIRFVGYHFLNLELPSPEADSEKIFLLKKKSIRFGARLIGEQDHIRQFLSGQKNEHSGIQGCDFGPADVSRCDLYFETSELASEAVQSINAHRCPNSDAIRAALLPHSCDQGGLLVQFISHIEAMVAAFIAASDRNQFWSYWVRLVLFPNTDQSASEGRFPISPKILGFHEFLRRCKTALYQLNEINTAFFHIVFLFFSKEAKSIFERLKKERKLTWSNIFAVLKCSKLIYDRLYNHLQAHPQSAFWNRFLASLEFYVQGRVVFFTEKCGVSVDVLENIAEDMDVVFAEVKRIVSHFSASGPLSEQATTVTDVKGIQEMKEWLMSRDLPHTCPSITENQRTYILKASEQTSSVTDVFNALIIITDPKCLDHEEGSKHLKQLIILQKESQNAKLNEIFEKFEVSRRTKSVQAIVAFLKHTLKVSFFEDKEFNDDSTLDMVSRIAAFVKHFSKKYYIFLDGISQPEFADIKNNVLKIVYLLHFISEIVDPVTELLQAVDNMTKLRIFQHFLKKAATEKKSGLHDVATRLNCIHYVKAANEACGPVQGFLSTSDISAKLGQLQLLLKHAVTKGDGLFDIATQLNCLDYVKAANEACDLGQKVIGAPDSAAKLAAAQPVLLKAATNEASGLHAVATQLNCLDYVKAANEACDLGQKVIGAPDSAAKLAAAQPVLLKAATNEASGLHAVATQLNCLDYVKAANEACDLGQKVIGAPDSAAKLAAAQPVLLKAATNEASGLHAVATQLNCLDYVKAANEACDLGQKVIGAPDSAAKLAAAQPVLLKAATNEASGLHAVATQLNCLDYVKAANEACDLGQKVIGAPDSAAKLAAAQPVLLKAATNEASGLHAVATQLNCLDYVKAANEACDLGQKVIGAPDSAAKLAAAQPVILKAATNEASGLHAVATQLNCLDYVKAANEACDLGQKVIGAPDSAAKLAAAQPVLLKAATNEASGLHAVATQLNCLDYVKAANEACDLGQKVIGAPDSAAKLAAAQPVLLKAATNEASGLHAVATQLNCLDYVKAANEACDLGQKVIGAPDSAAKLAAAQPVLLKAATNKASGLHAVATQLNCLDYVKAANEACDLGQKVIGAPDSAAKLAAAQPVLLKAATNEASGLTCCCDSTELP
jgi:hypothetical protein